MIHSRLVLNFPGFEQTDPERQIERIRHSAEKTGVVWNFACERLSLHRDPGANHATCDWRTRGEGWEVRTRIVQFSWNDIIRGYESEPHPRGFIRNLPKFLAFFADGTANRYWRASQRYWAFTIFPILLIAIFLAGSWFAASWLVGLVLAPGLAALAVTLIATLALTLVLCKWPGDRLYLLLTVNDWGFARDMVNRLNPAIETRYLEFAETLSREISEGDHDEIVVSGHSFGSVWAVAALALALQENPDLIRGRRVAFLALGSSLLKIALAPAAKFMRDWTALVFAQPGLFWHEIQTKDDIIAFYRANPLKMLRIKDTAATMQIDRVRYKKAMDRARYRAMRTSFYRTHRQYILYQDKPVAFDYMIRLFGPVAARDLAVDPENVKRIDPRVSLV